MSLNCTFNYGFVNRNQVVNKTNRNNIMIELQSFIVQDISWRRLHKCKLEYMYMLSFPSTSFVNKFINSTFLTLLSDVKVKISICLTAWYLSLFQQKLLISKQKCPNQMYQITREHA